MATKMGPNALLTRCFPALALAIFVLTSDVYSDDIDVGMRKGTMLKVLRQMVNQTKADTLNLPSNATTIRQNITDTFRCENRTYGYYADVDNECQVFHVCLTSQNPSGRNVTYRWSFICPNETIFNQEVLTCARPRDFRFDCEDAPLYYDLNMEIGKTNETAQSEPHYQKPDQQNPPKIVGVVSEKRKPSRKKNNLVVENIRDIVNGELKKQDLQALLKEEEGMPFEEVIKGDTVTQEENKNFNKQKVSEIKTKKTNKHADKTRTNNAEHDKVNVENNYFNKEESLKSKAKKKGRMSFRFKADV